MPPVYITTKEAVEIIGVKLRQVQAMLKSGELVGRKFGRDWQVLKVDAERAAKERRKPGRPRKMGEENA